ncbi:MAG: HTH-type transcriptional activator HxlR [Burkholderia sp.]|jgi:DNA-binding HxlR family transcriptional regulator
MKNELPPCCRGQSEKAETAEKKETEVLCPVAATLSLIGGKHKSLILWNLLEGTMRYSDLRRAVPAATPKMLTQQLRELEADGFVTRHVYPVVPPKVEYSLTETGRSLKPILTAMYRWGSAYLESRHKKACCSMKPPAEDSSDPLAAEVSRAVEHIRPAAAN